MNFNHHEMCGICHATGCVHMLLDEVGRRMGVPPNDEVATLRAKLKIAIDALVYIRGCGSETAMPMMDGPSTALWFTKYAHKALHEIGPLADLKPKAEG